MSTETFFVQAFVYLAAAVVAVPLAKRFGLGSVLGYLLAGAVIGPFGLGLVGSEGEDVMHFAEFGVVMMLFVIGLELEPALLWRMRIPILGLGGAQVVLTTLGGMALALAFGFPWQAALAVGMTVSLSSTAIVLQTLEEKGLLKTSGGQSSFAVLLFQDIAVIPMLALLPLLATGHGSAAVGGHGTEAAWIDTLPAWARTMAVLGAVGLIVVGGRYLLRPVLRAIGRTRMREVFTAGALLLVVGIALLMDRVGLSPALGTFLAGVVLANSEYRHELESDIEPFKGLLLGIFFIAVGASIDFALIQQDPGVVFGLTAGLVVLKLVILGLLAGGFRMGLDQGLLFSLGLAQTGEFAFVLLSFAGQEGVLDEGITGPLVAAVALSMALTPLLLLLNERLLAPRFGTRREARESDAIHEKGRVLIAGFGSFGSTVGRLLRANGVDTTVLDFDSDRVELLRTLGIQVYYGDATRHDLLEAAGAQDADVLVVALDTPESTMKMIETVQKHFPDLHILARAFDWEDAHDLQDARIDGVYREDLDTALRMGTEALQKVGFRAYQAHRAAQKFLRHDEESLAQLTEHRKTDQKVYLSEARRRIQELEQLLRADLVDENLERDAGWDPESVRKEFGSPGRSSGEAC